MKIGTLSLVLVTLICSTLTSGEQTSVRSNSDSCGIDVFADLLVWTAREAGADCWAEVLTSTSDSFSNDLLPVNFGWDPGFRVGLGYEMNHDSWDTQFSYTWFYTHGKDAISGGPGSVHSTFVGAFYVDNPTGQNLSGLSYESATIDWTIHFNMFDWELGRDFWISKALSFRPFLGIKGGWIDQSIHTKWYNPNLSGAQLFHIGTENIKNDFWGVGPSGGINTEWNLLKGQNELYLFGDFSGAMMWGHWAFADVYENDLPQKVTNSLRNINSGASMFRTFMGFGWDYTSDKNRYRFSTKLGYEMQFWLDQLQFYSFIGGRLVNELTLQGGTLEFSFDF